MKKIGIDARLYFQTGVGTYIRNLLYYLQKIVPKNIFFYIYVMKNDFSKINFENKQFIKKEVSYPWHSVSEQMGFWQRLIRDNLDLMHFTYFSYPVLYKRPFVATVHDVTPLLFRTGKASTKNPLLYQIKHFFFRHVLKNQIRNSSALITPSATVKKQLVNIYGEKYQSKIFPIYEGVDKELKKTKENRALEKQFAKPFFIYVGNFYPHKNVERLIKAFAHLKTETELILIGPNNFFAKHLLLYCFKSIKSKIKFYFNPTLADLVFFYHHAKALINPSLSEGFGLPLLEAAYFGCPIIASKIPVFQEILNGEYLTFNPYNVMDITAKLNFSLKNRLFSSSKNIIKKFSFAKMAKKTLKIYRQYV